MFFGAGGSSGAADRYATVLAVAREIDGGAISAVWTPERHYHPFGGLFPQPAVLAAAIATSTTRLKVRAGSVVAPLHSAAEIVEQWAVVDSLSNGRVELALASGWNSVDFWTVPDAYENRYGLVQQRYREINELWTGAMVDVMAPDGVGRRIRVYPTPVQARVPISLAASGSPETFRAAGRLGAGVLTHLLGQSIEELASNIAIYRDEYADAGHGDERSPKVAVMVHTYLSEDPQRAVGPGTAAFVDYLMTSIDLDITNRPQSDIEHARRLEIAQLRARHHVANTALIGGFDAACARLSEFQSAGVDEVAFLIDFGVPDSELVPQARLLSEWAPRFSTALAAAGPPEHTSTVGRA